MARPKLYGYFRSSAAYRVRMALNIKDIAYENISVHLVKNEQNTDEYLKLNPQGLVPTYVDEHVTLGQSLAIINYLDETHAKPPLVFGTPAQKAYIRQLSYVIACDTHPLNNLKVLKYLESTLGVDSDAKKAWYRHWAEGGLRTFENIVAQRDYAGQFCAGDNISLADICLLPQLYNARRFNIDLSPYPILQNIERNCMMLKSIQDAAPETQPDAPDDLDIIHGPGAAFLSDATE